MTVLTAEELGATYGVLFTGMCTYFGHLDVYWTRTTLGYVMSMVLHGVTVFRACDPFESHERPLKTMI